MVTGGVAACGWKDLRCWPAIRVDDGRAEMPRVRAPARATCTSSDAHDTQAGLKGFRTPVARHLFGLQRITGLGFDAELLFLARKFGYRVAEIPARVGPAHAYKTSKGKLLRTSLRMMIDVLQVRRNDATGRY